MKDETLFLKDPRAVGRRLRKRRLLRGLSQTMAAESVDVSTRLWSETERGVRPNLSFTTLGRMLEAVGGLQEKIPVSDENEDAIMVLGRRAIRSAEEFGVDVSLLRASLDQSVERRLEENDEAVALFRYWDNIRAGVPAVCPGSREDL